MAKPGGIRLAGLAHGASGVAHALLRLDERSGSERLRAAAVDAFHYERTLFDADRGNCGSAAPTFRPVRSSTASCNGAGGIVPYELGGAVPFPRWRPSSTIPSGPPWTMLRGVSTTCAVVRWADPVSSSLRVCSGAMIT